MIDPLIEIPINLQDFLWECSAFEFYTQEDYIEHMGPSVHFLEVVAKIATVGAFIGRDEVQMFLDQGLGSAVAFSQMDDPLRVIDLFD